MTRECKKCGHTVARAVPGPTRTLFLCDACGSPGAFQDIKSEVTNLRAEVERLTQERAEVMAGFGPVALEAADMEVDRLRAAHAAALARAEAAERRAERAEAMLAEEVRDHQSTRARLEVARTRAALPLPGAKEGER